MKFVTSTLTTILILLFVFALLLIATLIVGLGIILVGHALSFIAGLSLFEASLIALGGAFGIVFVFANIRAEPVFDPVGDAVDFEDDEPAVIPPRSRNDPCPCGSGRKYKHCHGRVA
jgi:hypothetical protein